jgi:uncharacterized protein YhaN
MRLVQLEFKAFGPFTGLALDFDGPAPGLHLVFGANEAGKSSALRGLTALLFGFPSQTPDNFLHSYDQLLVAGRLRHSSGEELSVQRRKRRVADLLDKEGNPLDPQRLAPYLQGLDAALFSSLYGIAHDTLVRGGEELLAQKGEVGQVLFAAGAGLASVHETLRELESEAASLFLPAGQKPPINASLRRLREVQQQVREAALGVALWKEQRRLLEEAELARDQVEKEREGLRSELQRLERLGRAAPELAALRLWRQQLAPLSAVPALPEDFAERFQRVQAELREGQQVLKREGERLVRLRQRRDTVTVKEGLLRAAPLIDGFHRRLGEYLKGQKDRPERNGMRIALRSEAGQLLQLVRPDLRLEQAEELRPMLVKKRAIQALANSHGALLARHAAAVEEERRLATERRLLAEEVAVAPPLADAGPLLQAVKAARLAGDIDARLAAGRGEYGRLRSECLAALSRQRLWQGDFQALERLPLPLAQTVHGYVNDYAEQDEKRRELEKDKASADGEERRLQGELRLLDQGGAVPSEAELAECRRRRDQGWFLVRGRLEGESDAAAEEGYACGRPLVAAYEEDIARADTLADRLRHEADRVAAAASLRARLEELRQVKAGHLLREEELYQRHGRLQEGWLELWRPAGIVPLGPREMLEWLGLIEQLRFRLAELAQKEETGRAEADRLAWLRQQLATALAPFAVPLPAEPGLAAALLVAEERLQHLEESAKRQAALLEAVDKAAREQQRLAQAVTRAGDELAAWGEQWRGLVAGLGRSGDLLPLEAMEMMEALQGCFDRLRQADELQKRIDGIDRDATLLENEVARLAREIAPDLAAQPVEQAIAALRQVLEQAVKEATLAAELDQEIIAVGDELALVGVTVRGLEERLGQLLAEARCHHEEEAAEVIRQAGLRRQLEDKLFAGEERLAMLCPGMSEEEVAVELQEVDVAQLPGLVAQLQVRLRERLDPEVNRLSQLIGQQQSLLAAMDGAPRAALLQEEVEAEGARLRRLAHRYAQVKVAERVLRQAIERYREEHQSPVIELAANYFRRLTLGSFVGLRADSDDSGHPVLVGVRPGEQRLDVSRMSSGSRDQLYLALRLATLAWRAKSGEPMPLVLDDILINFDDARSRATLELLAQMADSTQVILFTHHRRIVDEAQRLTNTAAVRVHTLAEALPPL